MITDINKHYGKVFSQEGEDGIISAVFNQIGTTNRYFVEFGVGTGKVCNSRLLYRLGWQGLMMDNKKALPHVKRHFITAENIQELFRLYNVPQAFDMLSIDVDGNDYWLWQAITNYKPRLVVIEYNSNLAIEESKTIPYSPSFRWNGSNYYGASLLALTKLGTEKGYTLIGCDRCAVNAYFVQTELIEGNFNVPGYEGLYKGGKKHRVSKVKSYQTV